MPGSPEVEPHEHSREPVEHRLGVGGLREPRTLEQLAGARVGHGEVDLLAPVVERIALDRRRAVIAGEFDGAGQQVMRDALAAMPRSHTDAPHRPHVEVVDVRDPAVVREARVGARGPARPAHALAAVVGEDTRRRILPAQLLHPLAALGALESQVLLGGHEPVAQAETPLPMGPLRPDHRLHVVIDGCRSHLDRHVATLPPASDTGNGLAVVARGWQGGGMTTADATGTPDPPVVLFWGRTDVPGLERLELRAVPGGILAEATVLCLEDGGFRLDHRWRLTPDWRGRGPPSARRGAGAARRPLSRAAPP